MRGTCGTDGILVGGNRIPGGNGGIAGSGTAVAAAIAPPCGAATGTSTDGEGGTFGALVGGTAVGTITGTAVEIAITAGAIVADGTVVGDGALVGAFVAALGALVAAIGALVAGTAVEAGEGSGARVGTRGAADIAGTSTRAGALAEGATALLLRPNDCRARKPMASNAMTIAAMP
ncbi:MAG: hypothetical protein M3176_08000, partial [Chloroflexota bacterium]|nr:hypothetical protein [Chloroflexota bacterium]